jgi:dihydroorotase
MLKWGTEMHVALADALAPVTSRAAAAIGIEAGRIAPGAAADLCLFDPGKPWVVLPSALASQGKNTPFLGFEMTGRVARTVVGGRSVYID